MTVNEKLQALKNAKTSIEQAIIAKGGDLTGKNITQYGDVITELPSGEVTSFDGIKEFASLAAAEELKNYNTIGAVLSLDNGVYKAWNGNPNKLEWDFNAYVASCAGDKYEQNKSEMCGCYFINSWADNDTPEWPSDTHGKPIAVCVGKGLWAKLDWEGLTKAMMWATSGTKFYNNFIPEAFGKDGEKITVEVLKRDDLTDSPLFSAVKAAGDVFVPSAFQCREIWDNLAFLDANHNNRVNFRSRLCCAIKYVGDSYWSSSQYTGATNDYGLSRDGFISYISKDFSRRSFACLRFGA